MLTSPIYLYDMGVRQKIIHRNEIVKRKVEIENHDCQLVLRSGEVFFIRVAEVKKEQIISKNQFGHKMNFMVHDVEECIIDYAHA